MPKQTLVVDIETMPDTDAERFLPPVEASKTLKDKDKIDMDILDKKMKQRESMALSPLFGKIACICVYNVTEDEDHFFAGEEKEILKNFLNLIKGFPFVITYNGKGFDFPFVFKRAMKYNLANIHDLKIWTDKYKSEHHKDIMLDFCDYGKFEKLNTLAQIYLGQEKEEIDFKEIPELLKTEEGLEKLRSYCTKDVHLTYELAKKFGYVILN